MRRAVTAPIAAADGERQHDEGAIEPSEGPRHRERGDDGDRHADHAEQVAAAGGRRARQAAQRQDEQDARDEVKDGREIGVHGTVLTLLAVHGEHAARHEEAAEDVHGGHDEGEEAEAAAHQAPRPTERSTPTASSAPTTITEEIAFVTAISGVWQRRRDRPHDVVADEDREHEDREAEHERVDDAAGRGVHRVTDGVEGTAARRRMGDLVGIGLRGIRGGASLVGGGPCGSAAARA